MKKYYLSFLLIVISSITAMCQQLPQFTQYMINPFLYNPAVAGTEDYMDIRAGYRKQWTGFAGSPSTSILSAHTNIGKSLVSNNRSRHKKNGFHGVGGIIENDAIGPTNTTTITGAYSYHLTITKKIFASLGASGGIEQFSMDGAKLNTYNPSDPAINSYTKTSLANINTGFWIYSDKFYAGGSLQQVLDQKLYNQASGAVTTGSTTQHYFFMAGYRIPFGYDFTLIPSICIKGVSPAPVQYDINAKVRYKNVAWAGISYRNQDAVAFMLGVIVNNTYDISYSYDYTTSAIGLYSGGSHEIMIGYRLKPKGKVICPSKFW
jgi:type IX secretion system PorP/SprF family membrane protein